MVAAGSALLLNISIDHRRKQQLFNWLKELANATSAEAFRLRLQRLKESSLYTANQKLQVRTRPR
jgi:hypothetical protein